MEPWILIAAAAGPILGLITGNWAVQRELRKERDASLSSLRAGCTRKAELAEFYSRKKPPTTCQCAAILGIRVTKDDCPITGDTK